MFPVKDDGGFIAQDVRIPTPQSRSAGRNIIAHRLRDCCETSFVVASVEQTGRAERRRRGVMIAQYGAEGGVLGTVEQIFESPGDGTVLTQTIMRWNHRSGFASLKPRSGGMKLAGAVRPRSEWNKMRAAERRHRAS